MLVLHALTGDSHAAGPAGPGHPIGRVVGRPDRARCPHRHRPLLRGLPQRPRRVPGHDRAGVAGARRCALRLAVPGADHPRPGGGRGGAGRPAGHRAVGRRWSGARWAGCGSSSGASAIPTGSARAVVLAVGAAATAEQIALCSLQVRAIRSDPAFAGGDYYGAAAGPVEGLALARGIGQVGYRTELELEQPVRPEGPGPRGPAEGRSLRGRVLPGAPRGQAGPAVRPQLVHRPQRGHEPPRRGPGPRRGGPGPGRGPGRGHRGRHRLGPALPPASCRRSWPGCSPATAR